MRMKKHLVIPKQQYNGSQNKFLDKMKQLLDVNVRKKLLDALKSIIHECTGSIYNDIMVTKAAAIKSNRQIKIVQARTKETERARQKIRRKLASKKDREEALREMRRNHNFSRGTTE